MAQTLRPYALPPKVQGIRCHRMLHLYPPRVQGTTVFLPGSRRSAAPHRVRVRVHQGLVLRRVGGALLRGEERIGRGAKRHRGEGTPFMRRKQIETKRKKGASICCHRLSFVLITSETLV
jgi:hypothetical protein